MRYKADIWDDLQVNMADLHETTNDLLKYYDALFSGDWSRVSGGMSEAFQEYAKLSAKIHCQANEAFSNLQELESND